MNMMQMKNSPAALSMKAIVYSQYGAPSVLKLATVERPVPKANEVLVKIHATAVNSGDCRLRKADPFAVRFFFGLTKPKIAILGGVFSGEVVEVGAEVKKFKTGDQVFGTTGMGFGAYAEYKCLPETGVLSIKPASSAHEMAAAIPFGGTAALHFIKKANIQRGQKVLIYGASGALGTAAVQLAKYFGAEVTGVCSTANVAMVKSLGADKVIDYTKEDFSKSGEIYDVVFETVGKASVSNCKKVLHETGIFLQGSASLGQMLQALWMAVSTKQKVFGGVIKETAADMDFLASLLESGKLIATIDKTYPLAQMKEAHEYVDGGHKRGNVVVRV